MCSVVQGTEISLADVSGSNLSAFKSSEIQLAAMLPPLSAQHIKGVLEQYSKAFVGLLPDEVLLRWAGRARPIFEYLVRNLLVEASRSDGPEEFEVVSFS